MSSKRNLIIRSILGIAVVLGFVALRGVKVPPGGTEGAIGAANRYQSGQIGDKDVTVTDQQIQAFVQSDLFHKIATNPEFQKIALIADYQTLAAKAEFQNVTVMAEAYQPLALGVPLIVWVTTGGVASSTPRLRSAGAVT